jgi:hypothetical protein
VILEPEAVSFEETSEVSRQEFKRKVRLATWNLKSTVLLMTEAVWKGRLFTAFILLSHRFLRYTTPLWVIAVFVSNLFLLEGILFYVFLLQVIFFLAALLGFIMEKSNLRVHAIFLMPFYFCMVNWAAFLAVMRNLFNRTEVLWEKA